MDDLGLLIQKIYKVFSLKPQKIGCTFNLKNILFIALIINLWLHSIFLYGSDISDSSQVNNYSFHLNHKPQDGLGLTLAYFGTAGKTTEGTEIERDIFKIGITNTKHIYGEEIIYTTKSASLEINRQGNKNIYGITMGVDKKAFILDLGIFLNYMTDFSTTRVLALRPRFGLSFLDLTNLDLTYEYDIYGIKRNYKIISPWLIGIQYTIGVLKRN